MSTLTQSYYQDKIIEQYDRDLYQLELQYAHMSNEEYEKLVHQLRSKLMEDLAALWNRRQVDNEID
jgi:hypothetical protein